MSRPRTRSRHSSSPGAGAGSRLARVCANKQTQTDYAPTLRVLVDETVAELILKPHLCAFMAAHPSLSIEFQQHAWTSDGSCPDVDVALQYAPALSAPANAAKLGVQRLLTCAAPHYLRERGVPQHPLDLERHHHEVVVVSRDNLAPSSWKFADSTESVSVAIQKRAEVPSLSAALALALGGAGVSQIPECWAIGHVRSGRLVRLLPEWEASLNLLAFEPRSRRNSNTQALLRFVGALIDMGAPGRPC